MATGEIRIDVDNTTKTTTIVDEEITLTYEDIIEMFTDREVSVTGVTSVMMEIRNFGGLVQKILTSENNVTFKIKKITTVDTLT
jgi:ferritin